MKTRAKSGIHKPKVLSATISQLPTIPTPTCFSQAVKETHWRQAMQDEFNAFILNQTWVLVPSHKSKQMVGCKWVFRVKHNSDGTIS